MGYHLHSLAVIGLKLEEGDLDDPQDPIAQYIAGYNAINETLHGFKIVSDQKEDQFVCLYLSGEETTSNGGPFTERCENFGYDFMSNSGIEKFDHFRKVMKKAGVWRDENFGLWSILWGC